VAVSLSETATGAGGTLQNLHYTYDNVGNITGIVDDQWTGDRELQSKSVEIQEGIGDVVD
jgi:hypothetical protein